MDIVDSPSVAIIILNWNNWQDTVQCLESLSQIDYPNYQIVVVDNGSTDDSVLQLKQRFNAISLLESEKNLGFSGGVNFGIEQMKTSDLILLLNNDTLVEKDFLTGLVRKITSNDTIGLVGGKIYYYEAAECDAFIRQLADVQSIKGLHSNRNKIWSAGGGISKLTKRTFHFGENKNDRGQYDQEREVDFLSGCCLLVKRDVIEKIGLLDPDYFMYYEDVDFCLRAKEQGYKILYVPGSIIWHKVRQPASKRFVDYYRMKNHLLLLQKRYAYKSISRCLAGSYLFIERTVRILMRKLIYRNAESVAKRIRSLWRGYFEGLTWNG
jgi:GT2 family glycosyltransferase